MTPQPHHILRRPKSDGSTSPSTVPATQSDSHAWSSPHMKRHLQCAEQQVSPSNLTKYCACQEKWHCKFSQVFGKQVERHLQCGDDPSMIRGYLSGSTRPFCIEKYHTFRPGKISPYTAPATKNDVPTSPNPAPPPQTPPPQKRRFNLTKWCNTKWRLNLTKCRACHEKWHLTLLFFDNSITWRFYYTWRFHYLTIFYYLTILLRFLAVLLLDGSITWRVHYLTIFYYLTILLRFLTVLLLDDSITWRFHYLTIFYYLTILLRFLTVLLLDDSITWRYSIT